MSGETTKQKHVMVTCYDASFARILAESNALDSILVGDSLGNIIQGQKSTVAVTMEHMLYHVAAVARGLAASKSDRKPLLIADMPADSYLSPQDAFENAEALIDLGASMVKVEGPVYPVVRGLREKGISVCGHIGFTPQSIVEPKLQGKTIAERERLIEEAKGLEAAGVDLLVLELIPADLAQEITSLLSITTIGIGAGVHCGGQVLVLYDLLGFNPHFKPKFLKTYMSGAELVQNSLKSYAAEVRSSQFPDAAHSFSSPKIEKTSAPSEKIV